MTTSVDIAIVDGQVVEQALIMPLLERQALIMTAHELPVEGRVTVSHGGRIDLIVSVLPLQAERRWTKGLFVEYVVDTGVYRMRTSLRDIERQDGAFVVRMDTIDRPVLLLTRAHVRAVYALPVMIQSDAGWQRAATMDIGGGGVRLPPELELEVGDELTLELESVPGHAVIRATGRVVREAPEGGYGVIFTSIGDDARAGLMTLAFAQRRATNPRHPVGPTGPAAAVPPGRPLGA
jgi:hypothetical protein